MPGGDGLARSERLQPLLVGWLGRVLDGCRVSVRPVIDVAGLAPVDAYEIPDRMRKAVSLRSPASAFPYSRRTSRGLDLDHTAPYDPAGPPGQTSVGNLAPLSRRQHRAKTHGGWDVTQPWPGITVWKSPRGVVCVTTPSGSWTLRVPQAR